MTTGQGESGGQPLADPPQTEPATHSVLARLREMIVTGQIPPDAPLRAEALATRLAVSRTPIRSALAVLSAEGLTNYSLNRGYTVRAVTISDVFDSIEVRAVLEGLAAKASVDVGWRAADLGVLRGAVEAGRRIVDRGDWSEAVEIDWYQQNWIFHRQIHHASRNSVLRAAIRMTLLYPVFGDVTRLCPSVSACVPEPLRRMPEVTPPHIVRSQGAHERVLATIEAGSGEEAQRLMSDHVLATKQRLREIATLR